MPPLVESSRVMGPAKKGGEDELEKGLAEDEDVAGPDDGDLDDELDDDDDLEDDEDDDDDIDDDLIDLDDEYDDADEGEKPHPTRFDE